MKKLYNLLIIALFIAITTSNSIYGQGIENFEEFSPSEWYTGTWEGNNGQIWSFVNCKNFTFYGPTRNFVRYGHTTGTVSTNVEGGLGSLTLTIYHLWGPTELPKNIEVIIDGESYGTFDAGYNDSDGNNQNDSTTVHTIENINKEGAVNIELIGISNLGLDIVEWTGFIDSENPTPPGQPLSYNIAKNSFSVNWEAATDNSEVSSYDVYVDDVLQGNTENTYFEVTGLDPGQTYTVTVVAIDLSGNESEPSLPTEVTTLPADAPGIGVIPPITLYMNSGENFIMIPQIDDGNPDEEEELIITAVSNDDAIAEVLSVEYDNQHTTGYIRLTEKGELGATTIDLEISDEATTIVKTIQVSVVAYSKPGINFEVHDVVFWDEVVPVDLPPVFDTVISTAVGPPQTINWDQIELTVSQDCDAPQCDGHDFITLMYRGYVVPPANGSYTFYMEGVGDYGLWLSSDADFNNADPIAVKSSGNHESAGTDQGDGSWASAPQTLEKGKVYAIYGVNWTIHTTDGGILWEGPGVNKRYLQDQDVMYIYDTEKPSIPQNVETIAKSTESIRIAWEESSDNQQLAGYNVYLDGVRVNDEIIQNISTIIDGLQPNTKYTIAVTSIDEMGNESLLSTFLTETTYELDDQVPQPPSEIMTDILESMAVQISWAGATDNQAIYGYKVYVDGELFNTSDYIYDNQVVIKPLLPETSYSITIETVDVAFNTSDPSQPHSITMNSFDPDVNTLGVNMGRLNIEMNPIGLSQGLGINPKFDQGEFLQPIRQEVIDDLNPGLIRWGTIDANRLRFDNHIGSDKPFTIADFANLCIENNAYMSFTCGMEATSDWMQDENTFLHFLEYLGGAVSSSYGAIRAAEGYSEPLLDQLPGLIFEFGNEVWGADVHFAPIGNNYSEYAEWAREMAQLMKTSEFYDEDLIEFVYSGRNPNPNFSYGLNQDLLQGDTGEIDILALGGYIGSNFDGADVDQGESYKDYYKNAREDGLLDIQGLDHYNQMSMQLTGEFKASYLYETNTKNDAYNGRLGHSMIIMDYWLSALERGSHIPAIYSLSHGQWRITAPGENFKRLPVFHNAKLFNTWCRGHILETTYNSQSQVFDADDNNLEMEGVGSYAYSSGENFSIVLISRDFENDHYVEIELPQGFNFQSNAKQYVVSGEDFSTFDATVDSTDITITNNHLVTVPKHSMVLIRFTGDDQNFDEVEPGFFVYEQITNIDLTAETTEISENSGMILVRAETTPEEDYINKVNWEISQGDIDVTLFKFDKACRVKGSGDSNGNGTITLRATAMDNPEIYGEMDITITNQGTTKVNELENDLFEVFPNPSNNRFTLHLHQQPAPGTRVWITDVSGRTIMDIETDTNSTEITFGDDLETGVYFLNYIDDRQKINRTIIKN